MTLERGNRYHFGPRDQRGLIASLGGIETATLSSSLILAVLLLREDSHHLDVAFGVGGLGGTLAFVRVGDRSLVEWLRQACYFFSSALVGHHRVAYQSSRGLFVSRASRLFRGIRFVELTVKEKMIGALYDEEQRTLSVALEVQGGQFLLGDEQSRDQSIAEWSSVLATLTTSRSFYRVKWISSTSRDSNDRFRSDVAEVMHAQNSESRRQALHSYVELGEDLQSGMLATEQFVVLSTRLRYAPPLEGASPHPSSVREVADFLKEVALLERRLADGDLFVKGILTKFALLRLTRRMFDETRAVVPQRSPWPSAIEERWECIRTENLWHATFWISEWPRSDVAPGFLLPLLMQPSVRKNVALCMSPISPQRAMRRAEQQRTASFADVELRRRYGFALSSRLRTAHDATLRREEELSLGHAGFEFSGYVTVTASSLRELQRSADEIEQACALAHLEVRRLFGMQRESLLYGLFTARGCR